MNVTIDFYDPAGHDNEQFVDTVARFVETVDLEYKLNKPPQTFTLVIQMHESPDMILMLMHRLQDILPKLLHLEYLGNDRYHAQLMLQYLSEA